MNATYAKVYAFTMNKRKDAVNMGEFLAKWELNRLTADQWDGYIKLGK